MKQCLEELAYLPLTAEFHSGKNSCDWIFVM